MQHALQSTRRHVAVMSMVGKISAALLEPTDLPVSLKTCCKHLSRLRINTRHSGAISAPQRPTDDRC
jgi:hypothetical protein